MPWRHMAQDGGMDNALPSLRKLKRVGRQIRPPHHLHVQVHLIQTIAEVLRQDFAGLAIWP
jgi:hemoglobin-like flavoprotein